MILLILSMIALALLGLAWVVRRAHRSGTTAVHLDILAVALFVPLTVVFFWKFLFLGNIWMPKGGGDLNSYYYPVYRFAAASIQQGTNPLWNGYLYSGSPFAADIEASLFYPPLLFTYFVAVPFTYVTVESLLVLHYFIAAAGTYLYARTLGLGRVPAFTAGTIFAFGGFMVARLGHPNILYATVWFPLTLLFFHRALGGYASGRASASKRLPFGSSDCTPAGSPSQPSLQEKEGERRTKSTSRNVLRNVVAAGTFFGVSILGGHPQMPLYFAFFLSLYWVWAVVIGGQVKPDLKVTFGQRLRLWAGALRYAVLVPLVGFGIAAVQLLPTLELAGLSVRANIPYQKAAEYALEPLGLITMVVPHFFGNSFANYWGLTWSLTEIYAYVGIATLLLAGVSLLARRHRSKWVTFYALAAVFFLLVALGEESILHGWMYAFLPTFNKVRSAGRNLVFVDLSLALLAAYGLESLIRTNAGPRLRLIEVLSRRLPILSLAALAVITPFFGLALIANRNSDPGIFQRTLVAVTSYAWSAAFLAMAVVVIRLAIRSTQWRKAAPILLLAIIFGDLIVSNSNLNPTDQDVTRAFDRSDIVNFLLEQRSPERIDTDTDISDVWQPNMPLIYGFYDVAGLDKPLYYAAYRKFWKNLGSRSTRAYDLLGVRYVIARKGAKLDPTKFKLVKQSSGPLDVYVNQTKLPQAMVVPRAEIASPDEALDRLKSSAFEPTKVVLLHSTKKMFTEPGSKPISGEVKSISFRTPNEVLVSATSPESSFLVLNSVMYPGWKAYVDGKESDVLWANYIFRAVELPSGTHEIRFVFDPWTFKAGLAISVTSWIFVLGVLGLQMVRSRRVESKT
ncbi:MAG: YfhO family protein [Chloroflexi bacterium]|nr:YfhO family protein [Chloroflexota bacterium]